MSVITVFGGTGFLGQRIVAVLAARGHAVRLATRRPDGAAAERIVARAAKQSREAGGTVLPVAADIQDARSVAAAVDGADAVVNAVGLYVERGAATFEAVHVAGAQRVAAAVRDGTAEALVHISGIGADPASPSPYVRARAAGEAAVRRAFPAAILLRPSAMFGAAGGLLTPLLGLVEHSPVLPLFGRGQTRLQPVFVGDVATAIANILGPGKTARRVFELGGRRILTYRTLVERVVRASDRQRLLLPVPFVVWDVLAAVLARLPSPPLTEGQVALMKKDNVAAAGMPGLADLGVEPTRLETVLERRLG